MKYLRYYITPILAPTVIIGIFLGGHWMWLGLIVLFVVVMGGDAVLGEDASLHEYRNPWLIELPLHLALPIIILLLLSFAWASGSAGEDFLGIGKLLSGLFAYDFFAARDHCVPGHAPVAPGFGCLGWPGPCPGPWRLGVWDRTGAQGARSLPPPGRLLGTPSGLAQPPKPMSCAQDGEN